MDIIYLHTCMPRYVDTIMQAYMQTYITIYMHAYAYPVDAQSSLS